MSKKPEEKDEDIVEGDGAEDEPADAQDDVDDVDDVALDDLEDADDGEDDDAEDPQDADEGDDADPSDEEGEDGDADEGDKRSDKDLSAIEQKKRWRARALAAEAKLKKAAKAADKPSEKPNKPKTGSGRESVLINFRLDHPNLKSGEVAEIEAFAKAKGVSLETALKSDVIRIMIARNRKKQQQQGGGVSPSRRSVPAKPEKDFSRAGREEMEAEAARRRIASRQAKR